MVITRYVYCIYYNIITLVVIYDDDDNDTVGSMATSSQCRYLQRVLGVIMLSLIVKPIRCCDRIFYIISLSALLYILQLYDRLYSLKHRRNAQRTKAPKFTRKLKSITPCPDIIMFRKFTDTHETMRGVINAEIRPEYLCFPVYNDYTG